MKGILITIMILATISGIQAKQFKVNIIQTPSTETPVKLLNAIAEATNNTVEIEIVPSARAIIQLESGNIDIVFPATVGFDQKKNAVLKHDFSKAIISKIVIVLYTNKSKPIEIAALKSGNPKGFKVESTASLSNIFEFDTIVSSILEGSFKKLDKGTIDGFLYTQLSGDEQLKKLPDLKNIKRQLYGITVTTCALQKGASGGEADKMLVNGIDILKKNGKFDQIMGQSIKEMAVYNDWQP
jgi:ABC-type amino acid transport substrate-binding protein